MAPLRRWALPRWLLLAVPLALAACSEDGGAPPASPRNAADLIARRGTPTVFSIACGRHAYDAASRRWMPVAGFVRVDAWLYPNGSRSDVFVLVNGEVIRSDSLDRNIAAYPNPGFNPRLVGCGETETTW